jgi:hypothetical protein
MEGSPGHARRTPRSACADHQRVLHDIELAVVAPIDGVVADQVRQVVDIDDVVDRDEVEPVVIQQDLQCGPADSAETVDSHGRHVTHHLESSVGHGLKVPAPPAPPYSEAPPR